MSVLSDKDIRKIFDEREIIRNADLDGCLGPASYELRIGSAEDPASGEEFQIPEDKEFFIRPGGMVLIGTKEEVSLPNDVCAFLKLKSSLGRAGYVSWDQGFVDPGYDGSLTIALHNLTGDYNIFRGGQSICHIVFMRLSSPPSGGYEGEYHKSKGATASKSPRALVLGSLPSEMMREATTTAVRTATAETVKDLIF